MHVEYAVERVEGLGLLLVSFLLHESFAIVDWTIAQDLLALASFSAPGRLPARVDTCSLTLYELLTTRV